MNNIEHSKKAKETFEGVHYGVVIKVDDPEEMGRIKVRVHGVYDAPIKKEDIPWALPVTEASIPELGDDIAVIFYDGQHTMPQYLPKTLLSVNRVETRNELYAASNEERRESAVSDISVVGSTINEPVATTTDVVTADKHVQLYKEDVAKETTEGVDYGSPSKASVIQVVRQADKEEISTKHISGSFIDIREDGDVIIHGVKDIYVVAEGDANRYVKGKYLVKVDGDIEIGSDKDIKVKVSGNISMEADSNITMKSSAGIEIESPSTVLKGAAVTIGGTVAPTGTGAFCGIPACLLTGAPHVGNKATGN